MFQNKPVLKKKILKIITRLSELNIHLQFDSRMVVDKRVHNSFSIS